MDMVKTEIRTLSRLLVQSIINKDDLDLLKIVLNSIPDFAADLVNLVDSEQTLLHVAFERVAPHSLTIMLHISGVNVTAHHIARCPSN